MLDRADEWIHLLIEEFILDKKTPVTLQRNAVQHLERAGKGNAYVIGVLRSVVGDVKADSDVRSYAAQVLLILGYDSDPVVTLFSLAHNPRVQGHVQEQIQQSLRRQNSVEDATTVLVDLAYDPEVDNWVKCYSAQALGQMGHVSDATTILLIIATDSSAMNDVRIQAYQNLKALLGSGY